MFQFRFSFLKWLSFSFSFSSYFINNTNQINSV